MFLVTIKEAQWSSHAPRQNRPDQSRAFVHLGSVLGIVQDVHQLRQLLHALETIEAMIPHALALDPTLAAAQVTVAMTQVERVWVMLFPSEHQWLIRLLVDWVIVKPTNLELRLRPNGI